MARLAALLAAVLLTVPLPAAAQTVVADSVSEDATEGNSQPKLGRDASGAVSLIYVKPVAGFDQVFVASSADGGATWRSTQLTRRAIHSRYPSLAVETDGTLHAVWTTYEPIGHVYYARGAGGRWTAPVKVSPGQAYAGIPAVAVAPNRDVHLVWYGIRDQAPQVLTRHGSIYEILYNRLSGGRWTAPEIISPGVPDSLNPALAVDASGTVHSAWYQFDIRAYQVQYARRQAKWTLPRQITGGTTDAFSVAMAVGPEGRVYVVWERRSRDAVQIFFAEGPDRWSPPTAISGSAPGYAPTVAVDGRGRVLVAWENEGRLLLRRRTDRWLDIEQVREGGQNRHAILTARGEHVDLMWTQEIGDTHRLRFVSLGSGAGDRRSGRGGAGVLILAILAVLLLWQVRRRQRLASR